MRELDAIAARIEGKTYTPADLAALVAEVKRLRAAIRQYGRDTDWGRNPLEFGLAYARLLEALDA